MDTLTRRLLDRAKAKRREWTNRYVLYMHQAVEGPDGFPWCMNHWGPPRPWPCEDVVRERRWRDEHPGGKS